MSEWQEIDLNEEDFGPDLVTVEDENGVTKDVEHFCDYSYTYYLYPEDPGATVVLIESFDQYQPMYAVCADNEEAALERYEEFMKERP